MKNRLVALLVACLMSCSSLSDQNGRAQNGAARIKAPAGYLWTKLIDHGPWRESYNFRMFSINDTIWTFHHDGNWFSNDGVRWTRSTLTNSINNLGFLDYVLFKGAVYGFGNFEGNIDQFTLKSEIYRTSDLRGWTTIATSSNLPKRYFYHPFVFDGKIWIIGGEDKNTKYADIWNSLDGVTWTEQRDDLPFGKRSGSQVIAMNGKLFLLNNDVWSSTDALNWQKETDEIVKGEQIFGYAAVVFDNKIWLLGCNRNGQFSSQVLVSSDGKNWQGQDAPWTPRGGIAATVHNGKVYMTGGKYGGTPDKPNFIYSNDVWTLSLKE